LIGVTGISKVDGPDLAKYTEPYQYFIVGVPNKEFNHRFGMKAVFTLRKISPTEYNGIQIANNEDPLSGFNLKKTFTDIKAEILKDKDNAAKDYLQKNPDGTYKYPREAQRFLEQFPEYSK